MPALKTNNSVLQQNSLAKSVSRFLPYWPLFSLFLLIAFLLCLLYYFFTTPLYEASARVLIQDKMKGTENSKAMQDLDVLQSKKIIDNETDVIISKPLLIDVIKKLHLYAPVYKKNKLTYDLMYTDAPVIIEAMQPETLTKHGMIHFRFDAFKSTVSIDQHSYPLNEWQSTAFGQLKFLANKGFKKNAGETEFDFTLDNPQSLFKTCKRRLSARPTSKLSSIIEVNFRDENPQRAEDFVKTLLAAYMNVEKDDKFKLAENTLAFIEQRLSVVEKDLHDIEHRKEQYAAKSGAFDISTKGRLFLENVSANDQKMSEINMGLAVLDQVDDYVSKQKNEPGMVPSTIGIPDPLLAKLLDKLYNAELEYESMKKSAGENNPIVLPLKNRIEQIRPDITELIRNQRRNLEASRKNIYATNNSYVALLNTLPKTERELVDLDREQNIKSGVYSFLLQKKEETVLSQQSLIPESRLVSIDTTEEPVSPNMILISLGATLFAILLGMAWVVVKESFGNKVMFRDQIELATGFPVIGEISNGISHNPIVIGDDQKTFIAEQFRRLRMTLDYKDVNTVPKKILVTSAISGEGKSFIAANLALSLALTGKKVILLDFDLNNPSLNNKLNIDNQKGITEFLLGECNLGDIIQQTDLDPNLYLASTGQLPHNPTELLMHHRTEMLLKQLDKKFDYIVIDTAPVIPVTDAYILSRFCDATLYVIRHKYTPKIFLERMDEDNKMHRLNNVGIIFNSVASRGVGHNNYGYGYGYGYTYENSRKGKRLGHSIS